MTDPMEPGNIVLITYADTLIGDEESPLGTLHSFARSHLKPAFSTVHLLPFYPYSSDDGFSVIDFFSVDPCLGTWEDIRSFGRDFRLMFDYVLNHISSKSPWFQKYLAEAPGFRDLAIEIDPETDLGDVVRPRALPLLTAYNKRSGEKVHVWTTFSEDQIDLNYQSLDVLEKMIEVMLFYVEQGAEILRLDAVAYLWKEPGTPCIHLDRTHEMVRLFRAVLDVAAPRVMLLTETNVPHEENISYFGSGGDEAQMVYNFTLPPLLLHCFLEQDAALFSRWVGGLSLPAEKTAFFNFTASHDGIGVRPLEGLLTSAQIAALGERIRRRGGMVSMKNNPDGSKSPYELNITYVDAIGRGTDSREAHASRFLASQNVALVMPGVPGIYIHSLIGSRNWIEGVEKSGIPRRINREKIDAKRLAGELADPTSFRSLIFGSYLDMIEKRGRQPAFRPDAGFEVVDIDPSVFAMIRYREEQTIYALTNFSDKIVPVSLDRISGSKRLTDLLSGKTFLSSDLRLAPCQYVWLTG